MKTLASLKFLPLATLLFLIPLGGEGAPPRSEKKSSGTNSDQSAPAERGYLGAGFAPISSSLRRQLGIEEGVGLVAQYLDPRGPASAAGLEIQDILVGLDEQIIVGDRQLVLLVRRREPGSEVKLHVRRRGEKRTITVTLGSAPAQISGDLSSNIRGGAIPGPQYFFGDQGAFPGGPFGWVPGGSHPGSHVDQIMEDLRRQFFEQGPGRVNGFPGGWQGRSRPFPGDPESPLESSPGWNSKNRVVESSSTAINISDGEHHIFLQGRNGTFKLRLQDAENRLIYEGPYNGEEDYQKIPESVRRKIENARSMMENEPWEKGRKSKPDTRKIPLEEGSEEETI